MPTPINVVPLVLWPQIDVQSVSPTNPVEHTRVTVTYTVTNNLTRRIKGRVLVHNADPSDVRTVDLNPGESQRIESSGPAPAAGQTASLVVEYWDDDDFLVVGEFRQPNNVATIQLVVSATYQLIIGPVTIATPRSFAPWDKDTLLVSAIARYGPQLPPPDIQIGQPVPDGLPNPFDPFAGDPGTQVQQIGKVDKGIDLKVGPMFDVSGGNRQRQDLTFGPFLSVPGEDKVLRLGYLLANSGYGNEGTALAKDVVNALSSGAAAFLASYYQGSGGAWTAVDNAMKQIHDVLYRSCDALMGGGTGLMTSLDLVGQTAANGWYHSPVKQLIGDPAFPCNKGDYRGRWSVQRTSFRQVA